MSDAQIVEDLVQCVVHLTRHLEAENKILAKRDAAALQPLAEEKSRLTAEYLKIMEIIRRNPSLMQGLSQDTRDLVRHAGTVFNAVMEEHRRRVTALKIVGEGIIRSISEHVSARDRPPSYGQGPAARRPVSVPTSIAIDRNI
jgi:septal ring factor EnvC (AmiA/AmiB activator)